jgi:hypothetical protein
MVIVPEEIANTSCISTFMFCSLKRFFALSSYRVVTYAS